MANKKRNLSIFLFATLFSLVFGALAYFTWDLLAIQTTAHQNTAKKKLNIKEDLLNKLKNPPFVFQKEKSENEGRINPFEEF